MNNTTLLLAIAILTSACGGARTSTTTSSSETSGGSDSDTSDDTEEDTTAASSAPCTVYDPSADPTIAPADVARPPEHARRSISGLRWCVMRPGDGNARPRATDRVTVHYTGWTTDGEMFDSSHTRGEPATFPVNALIAGWTEGLQRMTVGEVTRFWIPQSIAYGGSMSGPRGMLVFDVELIAILAPDEGR